MTALEIYINSYFGIAQKDIEQIANMFSVTTLEKGAYFTKTDQYCDKLSFVTEGYLRVFAYANGKDITQWISSPGQFITDLSSIIFDAPARWNIQTLTDCTFYTISKTDYKRISEHVKQWEKLEKLFIAKCFIDLENRVFSFLSLSAEERFNLLFENNKGLFNQVPLHYLASMLGMTPETLSRIRKKISS